MAQQLDAQLESSATMPFYSEYMDMGRTSKTGFSMDDVCLVYDPSTANGRMGRITKQVSKIASRNIYTYASRPLEERICDDAHSRAVKSPGSTF